MPNGQVVRGIAPPDRCSVWDGIETTLSGDPRGEFNTAQEACGKFASERGRLALTLVHPDGSRERWMYHEIDRQAARMAGVLHRAGLRPGDRVAAILSRQVEAWITAIAAWRSGLVYVPMFCGFGSEALAFRVEASAARVVVIDHRWRDELGAALAGAEADPQVITVAGPRGIGVNRGDRSYWAELERQAADGPAVVTHGSDLATLLFTSGTTGRPKGCVISHSGLVSVLPFVKYALGVDHTTMLFATSDPAWAYGLYTTGAGPMALGVPRVIYTGDFDPGAWWRVVRDEHVTCMTSAPTAYRRLIGAISRYGVAPSLRWAAAAGEPLDAETGARFREVAGVDIADGYGLSEVGMVLSDLERPRAVSRPGTLAGEVPGFEVVVIDRSGQEVPQGEMGLIAIRRPRYQLSSAYDNDPGAWARRWIGDLFVTDDRGRVDEDGQWNFLGRDDDMIVTAGYNVGPVEVEAVLLQHPAVAEAAAVAAPDSAKGFVVRAVIVRHPGGGVSDGELEEQLKALVASRIGRHAVPAVVDLVSSLPRNEVGKVKRADLRAPQAR